MPAGWGFRPKPAPPLEPTRAAGPTRRMIAALLEDPAVLDAPLSALVRDVSARFKADGDVAYFAVLGARRERDRALQVALVTPPR